VAAKSAFLPLLTTVPRHGGEDRENFFRPLAGKAFYRFLAFMTLVVGVRMIFYHVFYTFPKYGIRELGDGAPVASLSGMLNEI
jgi:hypothetical protein